jgi:hypothetical protein
LCMRITAAARSAMDERRVEKATRNHDVALEPVLRIEYQDVKLLDWKIFHARRKVLNDVPRRLERKAVLASLARHSPA